MKVGPSYDTLIKHLIEEDRLLARHAEAVKLTKPMNRPPLAKRLMADPLFFNLIDACAAALDLHRAGYHTEMATGADLDVELECDLGYVWMEVYQILSDEVDVSDVDDAACRMMDDVGKIIKPYSGGLSSCGLISPDHVPFKDLMERPIARLH